MNLNNQCVKTVTKAIDNVSRFQLILLLLLITSVTFAGSFDKAKKALSKDYVYKYKISTDDLVYRIPSWAKHFLYPSIKPLKRSEVVK